MTSNIRWAFGAVMMVILAVAAGCKRTMPTQVMPIFMPTATSVFTNTPIPSATATHTRTRTNTPTITNTRTHTPVPTNTFTGTPTFTRTNTPIPTDTFTATSTFTPTDTFLPGIDTPTDTTTFTSTFTPSHTHTFTPSPTPTDTVAFTSTHTPTVTDTPSGCVPAVLSTYDFPSDIQCWDSYADVGVTITGPDWVASPSGNGAGALHAFVDYDPANQKYAEFSVTFPTAQDLTGKVVSVRVRVNTAVKGTAWGGAIQPFIGTGPVGGNYNSTWTNITGYDSFYTYTHVISSPTANDTKKVGVQIFMGSPGAASGDVYVDDFSIHDPFTPTPTIPVATGWYFESAPEMTNWSTGAGGGATIDPMVSLKTPPYAGATALGAQVTYSAQNQDAYLQYTYPTQGDLTGKTIRIWAYVSAAAAGNGYPGGEVFIQSNAWSAWEASGWSNLTIGGWKEYIYTPTWATSPPGAPANVQRFGFHFMVGGSGSAWTPGDIMIDTVEIY